MASQSTPAREAPPESSSPLSLLHTATGLCANVVDKSSLPAVDAAAIPVHDMPCSKEPAGIITSSNATGSDPHIRVVAKSRPLFESQQGIPLAKARGFVLRHEDAGGVRLAIPNTWPEKAYHLDAVYDEAAETVAVFEREVVPLLTRVLQGSNGTVFAYGPTGSGKTYLMQGNGDRVGLMQMSTQWLLAHIREGVEAVRTFDFSEPRSLTWSYFEVYGERLLDLLSGEPVDILEGHDGREFIRGLSKRKVETMRAFEEEFEQASTKRQTGATNLNSVSSRSHAILELTLWYDGEDADAENPFEMGKVRLLDLAGSEDNRETGNSDKRLKESSNINSSLFYLGRVIEELSNTPQQHSATLSPEKTPAGSSGASNSSLQKSAQRASKTPHSHVQFRSCKLTRILKDSLAGQSRSVMIACLKPCNTREVERVLQLAATSRVIRKLPGKKLPGSASRVKLGGPAGQEELRQKLARWREEKMKKSNPAAAVAAASPVSKTKTPVASRPALPELKMASVVRNSPFCAVDLSRSTKPPNSGVGSTSVSKVQTQSRPRWVNASAAKPKATPRWTKLVVEDHQGRLASQAKGRALFTQHSSVSVASAPSSEHPKSGVKLEVKLEVKVEDECVEQEQLPGPLNQQEEQPKDEAVLPHVQQQVGEADPESNLPDHVAPEDPVSKKLNFGAVLNGPGGMDENDAYDQESNAEKAKVDPMGGGGGAPESVSPLRNSVSPLPPAAESSASASTQRKGLQEASPSTMNRMPDPQLADAVDDAVKGIHRMKITPLQKKGLPKSIAMMGTPAPETEASRKFMMTMEEDIVETLNTAPEEELIATFKGIGPVFAKKINDIRNQASGCEPSPSGQSRPFSKVNDLRNIGMTPKKITVLTEDYFIRKLHMAKFSDE